MIPETPGAVRSLLAERGIRPRRRWGQNFLADANLRDALVKDAGVSPGDLVLEVGPGLGILTKGLLDRGVRLVAVELDRRLVGFLSEAFAGEDRLRLVTGDVLEKGGISREVRDALSGFAGGGGYRVVSNLPYSAASPFLAALAREESPPERILVMVQREVALRMTGAPGTRDYGPLAVLLSLRARTRIVREVGGRVFVPPPPVRSAVVEIIPREADRIGILAADRLARNAFPYRRKTLRKALLAAGYEREAVETALSDLGIEPGRRPEALLPQEFVSLGLVLSRK